MQDFKCHTDWSNWAKHEFFIMSDETERERESGDGSQGANLRAPLNEKPKPDGKSKTSSRPGREKERQRKERGGKERGSRGIGRSRSSDAERRGRETRRRGDQERDRGQRKQRGRSEEVRKKARDSDKRNVDEHRDDIEDTECVVCFCTYDNVFKVPKLLSCGHTFCLECLARINVSSPEVKSLSCPVCRELTDLPHGRDLPHLGNNKDIFRKLPPEMQRVQSVRFKRSKGKLVLKSPPPGTIVKPSLTLPSFKKKEQEGQPGDLQLAALEYGHAPATSVDVGRPPNRVRGRLRRLFRSDQCYYAAVASIITVTVALMLVGILAFVVVPHVANNASNGRPPGNNNSIAGNGNDSGP
ncbi:hypothetical protein AAFF_G00249930 [Aldrovandia affinis]|uniref:RING-type domain-containing protein n=1 Tax=Aldrovandia affinis TaxID=143900 RepID=A0AAD7W369_9TELE|nr:hypothetical protein AAFF_G00249930 [Aldrovandia affinis]